MSVQANHATLLQPVQTVLDPSFATVILALMELDSFAMVSNKFNVVLIYFLLHFQS